MSFFGEAFGTFLIDVAMGSKAFPRRYERFPQAVVQPCIVRLIRNIVAFVSRKDRKAIMPSVKPIYRTENAEAAAAAR
ncbi:MAG: transposase [Hyphomicrobiales bacterium]|nr:transposase [Hyphomicrobiales bacterium]